MEPKVHETRIVSGLYLIFRIGVLLSHKDQVYTWVIGIVSAPLLCHCKEYSMHFRSQMRLQ